MPGAGRNPWPPCSEKSTGKEPQVQPIIRHSLRNGLRLITRSPWEPGFLAPIAAQIVPHDLVPASGHQDHAISPSVSAAFVLRTLHVHRIPASRVVTIAIRPSSSRRDGGDNISDLGKTSRAYF